MKILRNFIDQYLSKCDIGYMLWLDQYIEHYLLDIVAVVLLVPCVVYISVTVSRYVFAGSLLKRESTIKQELINEREATRLVLKVSLAVLVGMVPVFVVAYALHDCLYACFGPYIAAVGSQVVIAVLGCVIAYFAIKYLSKSFTKHK